MKEDRRLKIGAGVLGVAALSLSAASAAMLGQRPDIATTVGRLLWAGALANLSLCVMWALVALIPLRRGEKWAFWAYALPIPLYGLPMLILDATNVPAGHLLGTLAPQLTGLLVAVVGLLLVAPVIFADAQTRTHPGSSQ